MLYEKKNWGKQHIQKNSKKKSFCLLPSSHREREREKQTEKETLYKKYSFFFPSQGSLEVKLHPEKK